jgi:hypothetical protein
MITGKELINKFLERTYRWLKVPQKLRRLPAPAEPLVREIGLPALNCPNDFLPVLTQM